ncbi:4Fe-4S dicluster domain-containing protein [bacterium]|nr:4Fe-4S dicluster domain-containing protein [bacterium]
MSALKEYFGNIFTAVKTVSKGMSITGRAFLKSNGMIKNQGGYNYGAGPVTISYPEVKDDIPSISRNRLFNHVEGCIACNQCAVICPVECITIESRRKTPEENPDERTPENFGNKPVKLKLLQFDIDEALCCFCGLCTEVCPTECLVHTTEYEYSKYDRDSLNYDYLRFKDDNPFPK